MIFFQTSPPHVKFFKRSNFFCKKKKEKIGVVLTVGLFGTAPAPALLKVELSQTVSTLLKIGAELGRALSQNELEK